MALTVRTHRQSVVKLSQSITDGTRDFKTMLTGQPVLYKGIRLFIHMLNRMYFERLQSIKENKLLRLSTQQPLTNPASATEGSSTTRTAPHTAPHAHNDTSRVVVRVPPTIPLSDEEMSVLSKGLKFVPLKRMCNSGQMLSDVNRFMRNLRLRYKYRDDQNEQENTPNPTTTDADLFATLKPKTSSWTPPAGQSTTLDFFIDKTIKDINGLSLSDLRYSNLKCEEWRAIKSLRSRSDIIIKPADKGGAVVVWSKEAYLSEGAKQLNDSEFYEKAISDLTLVNNKKVQSVVSELIQTKQLPDQASILTLHPSDLGNPCFYMLPKIHKLKGPDELPVGRPIVSAISCPTERISQFLDSVFQKIVHTLPTYVKDTNHALELLDSLQFTDSEPRLIFTMDVSALYTSIPHADGLRAIRHYLASHPINNVSEDCIVRLTELVLTLNSFQFNGEFFNQISGVAMGTKMGPSYANLFMGFLEEQIRDQYKGPQPEFFIRYIDDCLGITTMGRSEVLNYIDFVNNYHPNISYTYQLSSSSVAFLDIAITLGDVGVNTTVHYKDTDSHNYLLYQSSHPPKCKNSIPFSQLLRLRRLCKTEEDFHSKSLELLDFFRARHYPERVLCTALTRVKAVSRTNAMQPPKDTKQTTTGRPILVLTYHPHANQVRDIIVRNYALLQSGEETKQVFSQPPLVAYKRDKNLRDILVHSRISTPAQTAQVKAQPCNRRRCRTCNHLYQDSHITFPNRIWTLRHPFTCTDRNLVYTIHCALCHASYIGETGKRLGDRIAQHLRDIDNEADKPVSRHFNGTDHRGGQDLQVAVLLPLSTTKDHRRSQESRLIQALGTINGGINTRFDI